MKNVLIDGVEYAPVVKKKVLTFGDLPIGTFFKESKSNGEGIFAGETVFMKTERIPHRFLVFSQDADGYKAGELYTSNVIVVEGHNGFIMGDSSYEDINQPVKVVEVKIGK